MSSSPKSLCGSIQHTRQFQSCIPQDSQAAVFFSKFESWCLFIGKPCKPTTKTHPTTLNSVSSRSSRIPASGQLLPNDSQPWGGLPRSYPVGIPPEEKSIFSKLHVKNDTIVCRITRYSWPSVAKGGKTSESIFVMMNNAPLTNASWSGEPYRSSCGGMHLVYKTRKPFMNYKITSRCCPGNLEQNPGSRRIVAIWNWGKLNLPPPFYERDHSFNRSWTNSKTTNPNRQINIG